MSSDLKKVQAGDARQVVKVPRRMLLLGIVVFLGLILFVYFHVGDTKRFLSLLAKAELKWLMVMLVMQLSTYLCVGASWKVVIRNTGNHVPLSALARLSVEKLSIDQLIPTMGVSGNMVVYQSMKRLGLPHWLAMEAIIINLLSRYTAYALVTFLALTGIWIQHDITHLILYLVSAFALTLVIVPLMIIWLVSKKNRHLPKWILRFKPVANAQKVLKSVSPARVYSPKLLTLSTLFSLMVFLLDSGTLWAALRSLGVQVHFYIAFISIVMAYIAATVSLLPGGLGGFEAGAVSMLTVMGVPIEVVLTATLLLRGFTLWLPMIPGLYFARRDVMIKL